MDLMLYICPHMKRLLALSISLIVFVQGVGIDVSDLFMLKDLVEHAKFHSQEHGDDFLAFFEKHYGALKSAHQEEHQEEKPQHEKLPFQHNNCNHNLSEVVVARYDFPIKNVLVSYASEHQFHYKNLYHFLESAPIFQPPKIA